MLLIVDTRERATIPFIDVELQNEIDKNTRNKSAIPIKLNYQIEQINTGDYLICDDDNNIMLCIERKTYIDYAQSLKDGRYENKEKMLDLRTKSGCNLMFIIEGIAFPEPDRKFGHIPYCNIEASEFHMALRDNIHVMHTKDTQHTIKQIIKFMVAYNKFRINEEPIQNTQIQNNEIVGGIEKLNLDDIKKVIPKGNDLIIIQCWSALPAISNITGTYLATKFTINEFFASNIEEIEEYKINERKFSKNAIQSLINLHKGNTDLMAKLITPIRGISKETAIKITISIDLRNATLETLQEINVSSIPDKPRKLGPAKAAAILEILNHKNT